MMLHSFLHGNGKLTPHVLQAETMVDAQRPKPAHDGSKPARQPGSVVEQLQTEKKGKTDVSRSKVPVPAR